MIGVVVGAMDGTMMNKYFLIGNIIILNIYFY
jgi:hypothetical protein